jgi:predicted DNA-binding transcriptional regulator YafY
LYFLGSVTRTDLVNRFGIKEAAATRDLSAYREIAPKNASYDARAKKYLTNQHFQPIFPHEPDQALRSLSQGIGDDFLEPHRPLLSCALPPRLTKPRLEIVAPLTRAIHLKQTVEIDYWSPASGATSRNIAPFALVDSGLRWHVRAFDRRRQQFRDFVLTRMSGVRTTGESADESEQALSDNQWMRIVDVELAPHPNRENVKHPDAIELDYGMTDGMLKIQVRAAQAGYVLRLLNVDCSKRHRLKGKEYQLCLQNHPTLYGVKSSTLAPGYENQTESEKGNG